MSRPNWFERLIRGKSAHPADMRFGSTLDRHYENEYRKYREEGLRALSQKRVKEAIAALGRAALFASSDPMAHFDLGRALQIDGKTEAARQAYLRALELNPKLSEAKRALLDLPALPPNREDFHVGQRIKAGAECTTFTVLEVRKGGFGAVYIVLEEEFKVRWALKTFQARYLWSDEDRKRFEREALTWLLLDRHPGIVTAKGLMSIEGLPCLWLDYLPNNLAQLLHARPLSTNLALMFALQFCDGMFYAHRKMGIVHRDIKPSNCLLKQDSHGVPVLKITDFGLARTFAEAQERSLGLSQFDPEISAQLTTVAGTPQYMSPEQFRVGAVLDTRSDICSFGIMFYEMLTKDLPPVGFLAHSHISAYATSRGVPEKLKQIILRCVQPDPRERPRDFGELRNQLDAAHEQLTGGPYPFQPNPDALKMDSSDWNDKAIGLKNLGHLEAALTCYMRAVELSPNDATTWGNYGGCLYASGRFDEALSCFEKALEIDSNKPNAWCNKALVLETLKRPNEARTCYERAVELEPQNDLLWMNLGSSLADGGHPEGALDCYDRSLQINRRNCEVWLNKAKVLHSLKRNEEALVSCGEGLTIQPRHHDLWNTQACVLTALKRFEEALVACNRGLEIAQKKPYLWQTKGSILQRLDKPLDAEECFRWARTLRS